MNNNTIMYTCQVFFNIYLVWSNIGQNRAEIVLESSCLTIKGSTEKLYYY